MDDVAGFGRGPLRKQRVNLRPGDLWFPAMASKYGPCLGHFPPEKRITRCRQIVQDPQRLVPPPVEGKATEPGQPRRNAWTKGTSGATQRRFRFRRESTPTSGICRLVGER